MQQLKNRPENPKLSARRKAEYALSKAYALIEKRDLEAIDDVLCPTLGQLKALGCYPNLHAEVLCCQALSAALRGFMLDAFNLWLEASELASEPSLTVQIEQSLRILVEEMGGR